MPSPLRRIEIVLLLTAVVLALLPFYVHVEEVVAGLEFPLDDPYIYLQYARNLAAGHFYEYWPGEGYSAGATSPLYPWLLVPGFWLGLPESAMVAYTWGVSTLLVAVSACFAASLGRHFAGGTGAAAAVVSLLTCGAWLWGAMSGLEIGLFTALVLGAAWSLARDGAARDRSGGRAIGAGRSLFVVGSLLGAARPEGAPMLLVLLGCVLMHRERRRLAWSWAIWPVALLPLLLFGLLNWHYAGHFVPNTAVHKSALYWPRVQFGEVWRHMGGQWVRLGSALADVQSPRRLLPTGAVGVCLGLGWLTVQGALEIRRRQAFPAIFILLAGLAGTASASVARGPGQFFRYHHVGLALVSVSAGIAVVSGVRRLARGQPPLLRLMLEAASVLGLLGIGVGQLEPWSRLFARAAGEIRLQQVVVARWMDENLPADAIVLVNDVGAMTFLGHRRTFDLCGLTTDHQAGAFLEGKGALWEALERTPPDVRPTHLSIYPSWLGIPELLGRELFRTTLGPRVVAGGATVVVAEGDWRSLGSGEAPQSPLPPGRILDAIDVSDLNDEAEHGYLLAVPAALRGARSTTLLARWQGPDGVARVDGGRLVHLEESFEVEIPALVQAGMRIRLEVQGPLELEFRIDGHQADTLRVQSSHGVVEVDQALPSLQRSAGRHRVVIRTQGAPYRVLHYWVWGSEEIVR